VVGTLYSIAKDTFGAAWRLHFEIPEALYWLAILVAAIGFSTASPLEAIAWFALFLLGLQGVVRWHWHRGRGRRALILARFAGYGGGEARAREAQDLILTRLKDKLDPSGVDRVHAIPFAIGTAQSGRARRVRRRLRAWLLVYGRVSEQGGHWSVFARLLRPTGRAVHLDEHTRDVTPVKRSWGERVELLSPSEPVVSTEYPLRAADEIEAIIRASAGQVALFLGDMNRAASLLEEALAEVGESNSHAVDTVRVSYAETLIAKDEISPALALLRERERRGSASPELLRVLAQAFRGAAATGVEPTDKCYDESVRVLRLAAADHADPQREMSVFNLSTTLGGGLDPADHDEAVTLLEELASSSSFYRRAWYVHRRLGARAWSNAVSARAAEDEVVAEQQFRLAGKRYGRAIRLRPGVRFFVWVNSTRRLWTIYPPAAILRANLADVHDELGRSWRSKWQWWRCERKRDRLIRRGLRRFADADWEKAYANFDWVYVGRNDFRDIVALVYRAVAAWQYADDDEALASWNYAVRRNSFALITRAAMLRDPQNHPLVRGLPGSEETDLGKVMLALGMPEPPPGPLPPMTFGLRSRLFPSHAPTGGS
jgi:tetratricopeptide (TPR) repeat protein